MRLAGAGARRGGCAGGRSVAVGPAPAAPRVPAGLRLLEVRPEAEGLTPAVHAGLQCLRGERFADSKFCSIRRLCALLSGPQMPRGPASSPIAHAHPASCSLSLVRKAIEATLTLSAASISSASARTAWTSRSASAHAAALATAMPACRRRCTSCPSLSSPCRRAGLGFRV